MKHKDLVALTLVIFYLILFVPMLGQVPLFDWDEVNFAEAAREMLVSGDWLNVQINYEPFWEKPPLFLWLQATSMSLFGVNDMAARLPNAFAGLLSIWILYRLCFRQYGQQAAIASVMLYLASLTPHLYFRSGIIDPWFNLFIFSAVIFLYRGSRGIARSWAFILAGLFLGAAVLTKGPAALLITGLVGLVYQIIHRDHFYGIKDLLKLLAGILILPAFWFGYQYMQQGSWFIREFVIYQWELMSEPVASHGQPFYYHAVVLLLGAFPLTILSIHAIWFSKKGKRSDPLLKWMRILFWVVLILFSSITTKIVHYSSMCYLPMAVLGGEWLSRNFKLSSLQRILMAIISSMLALGMAGVVYLMRAKEELPLSEWIKDDFVLAQIHTEVHWSNMLYLFPLLLLAAALWLIFNYSKAKLVSYLSIQCLLVSFLLIQFSPKIHRHIQGEWVNHLQSYQNADMQHFTQGFKSYAHLYFSQQKPSEQADSLKSLVLERMGQESFYGMDRSLKQAFDQLYRAQVIDSTNWAFSLSCKAGQIKEDQTHLIRVFRGNGYEVWERRQP